MERKSITLTNEQIFLIGNDLLNLFSEDLGSIPVKLGFAFKKNIETFATLGSELNQKRLEVLNELGDYDEETNLFSFSSENEEEGNKRLQDIFSQTTEVEYIEMPIDLFDGVNMTPTQIAKISFMIGE